MSKEYWTVCVHLNEKIFYNRERINNEINFFLYRMKKEQNLTLILITKKFNLMKN